MEVYTSKHEKIIVENTQLSSGGEGEIRRVISAPARFHNVCAKIYYQKRRTTQLEQKIKYMVASPPAHIQGPGFLIGWPLECIVDAGGKFLGFVMPLAFPGSEQLIELTTTKIDRGLNAEWHNKYDRDNGVYALINRLKLINNISIPLFLLHATNKYVLKDFKPENVLVTYNGCVTLVDMDSVQISERGCLLFSADAATPNYMPPEYHTHNVGATKGDTIDQTWDYFAIGVVFYQLLMGIHPYVVVPLKDSETNEISQAIGSNLFPFGPNARQVKFYPPLHNKFYKLHGDLRVLFLRAFSSLPSERPSVAEWGRCVHALIQNAPVVPKPQPKPQPVPQPKPQPRPQPQPVPQQKPNPQPTSAPKDDSTWLAWLIAIVIVIVIICLFASNPEVACQLLTKIGIGAGIIFTIYRLADS